jgi:hypothetical protein
MATGLNKSYDHVDLYLYLYVCCMQGRLTKFEAPMRDTRGPKFCKIHIILSKVCFHVNDDEFKNWGLA